MSIWMIFRTLGVPSTADASGICGSRIVLAAGSNDPQRAVWKRTLQHPRLVPRRPEPDFVLLGRRQDDRHGLGMHLPHLGVRLAGQEREDVGGDLAFLRLSDGGPIGPQTGKTEQRPAFVRSKPDRHFLAVD